MVHTVRKWVVFAYLATIPRLANLQFPNPMVVIPPPPPMFAMPPMLPGPTFQIPQQNCNGKEDIPTTTMSSSVHKITIIMPIPVPAVPVPVPSECCKIKPRPPNCPPCPPCPPKPLPGPVFPIPYPVPFEPPPVILVPIPPLIPKPPPNRDKYKSSSNSESDSETSSSSSDSESSDDYRRRRMQNNRNKMNLNLIRKKKYVNRRNFHKVNHDKETSDNELIRPVLTYISQKGDVKLKTKISKDDAITLLGVNVNQNIKMPHEMPVEHSKGSLLLRYPDLKVLNKNHAFFIKNPEKKMIFPETYNKIVTITEGEINRQNSERDDKMAQKIHIVIGTNTANQFKIITQKKPKKVQTRKILKPKKIGMRRRHLIENIAKRS